MLPASMDPSVAPAPTIVWISSMKVIILPSDFLISLSTAFIRSSNSPRYLLPATIELISREMIRLFCSPAGTSPATTRWASPSTTAVFPTPGSPIRTGLFLVLRLSIWMTRRISASRPITGSSFPSRARSVRSIEYFSKALYDPSASGLVTLAPPRTSGIALRRAFASAPALRRISPASPSLWAIAISRCSVEIYSSPRLPISLRASDSTFASWRLASGWAVEDPLALGRLASARRTCAPIFCVSAPEAWISPLTTPPSWRRRESSRCSGPTWGFPAAEALCTASPMASWAIVVNFSSIESPVHTAAGSSRHHFIYPAVFNRASSTIIPNLSVCGSSF